MFVHEVLSDKNLLPVLDVDALLSLLHALACKVVEKSIIFFILNRSNDACFLVCRNAYRIYVVELISIVIVYRAQNEVYMLKRGRKQAKVPYI